MKVLSFECVVEGHGEVSALPILVKRSVRAYRSACRAEVGRPIRKKRRSLLKADELERSVEQAAIYTKRRGAVLVLLDSADDRACELAPKLLARARGASAGCPVSVVLACKEYEAWFLASIESLRSVGGLAADLEAVIDPEEIRGAKEWLSKRMPRHQPYRETLHQAEFSGKFNLDLARSRSASFDKLCREIEGLCDALTGAEPV